MRKTLQNVNMRIALFCCFLVVSSASFAQLSGGSTYPINGTNNPPSSFTTIQQAATYLLSNGVSGSGDIILELQSGYSASNEPSTGIYFDSIPGANATRRVILRPGTGISATISGSVAGAGIINLRATRYLTIEGRQGGTGTIGLTFYNASSVTTASTSTLQLFNDAQNNIIQYCNFQGASKATTNGGVIYFGTGVTTGNSFNTIENCTVDGTTNAHLGICSAGTTTSSTHQNRADTIRNCNIFDYYNPGVGLNAGIFFTQGSSGWVVTGNSIYQTASRVYTVQNVQYGIYMGISWTTDFHIITNNFIGGSGPNCSGSMSLSANSGLAFGFFALRTRFGGTGSLISGNIIKNINVSYTATAGSYANVLIQNDMFQSGTMAVTNNTIDSIVYTNNTGFLNLTGIYLNPQVNTAFSTTGFAISTNYTCAGNTVQNITANSPALGYSAVLIGIRMEPTSAATLSTTYTWSNTTTVACNNNTLKNLAVITNGNASTYVRGISGITVQGTSSAATLVLIPTINSNTLSNLSCNARFVNIASPVANGIYLNPANVSTATTQIPVLNNTIFDIYGTTTIDTNTTVTAMFFTNGVFNVANNRIYNIINQAQGSTFGPFAIGINMRANFATCFVYNNYISLGANQTNNVQYFGILNNFSAANTINIFNNSVMISGSGSGSLHSFGLLRGSELFAPITTPMMVKNNLLINTRANSSGSHYSMGYVGATIPWVLNNSYIQSNGSTLAFWNTTSIGFDSLVYYSGDVYSYYALGGSTTDFTTSTASVNLSNLFSSSSYATDANFAVDTTNSACWLLYGKGTNTTGVILGFDIYNNPRSMSPGVPITIGAHQFNTATTPPLCYVGGNKAYGDSTIFSFAGRNVARIVWGSNGTLPTSVACRYYSGKNHTLFTNASYSSLNKSSGYWLITGSGGSNYSYVPKLLFGSFERGNIINSNATTKMAFLNGSSWGYLSNSSADTTLSPMTASNLSMTNALGSATGFALTDNVSPLPVNWLSFGATLEGKNAALLQWTVSSQTNNAGFEVEKSLDGMTFNNIGFVKGDGNSNTFSNFQFKDHEAFGIAKTVFYRLKQLDADGNFSYSKIVSLSLHQSLTDIVALPNPFSSTLNINLNSMVAGVISVQLMDINGKEVLSSTLNLDAGYNSLPIETNSLPRGVYVLKLNNGQHNEVIKVVRQ